MDVIFFGSGAFGLPTLQALAREHRVVMVVSQPDRPAGRGSKLTPTPIADWAAKELPNVPLVKPENVNEPSILASVRDTKADAWVVIAFGQKLSNDLLADRFAINLHASLLPRWRGAAPINWAILAGDTETGNSVITLAEKIDAGLVLGQSKRPVDSALTIGELHDVLSSDGPALVLDVLDRFQTKRLEPKEQNASLVTIAKKLHKRDGFIEFSWAAEECRRRVHGLTPWPGVTVRFRGEPLKLQRVRALDMIAAASDSQQPGMVIDSAAGVVSCAGGTRLALIEVQPPGKKPMAWADFARGARVTNGELLAGGPAEPSGA